MRENPRPEATSLLFTILRLADADLAAWVRQHKTRALALLEAQLPAEAVGVARTYTYGGLSRPLSFGGAPSGAIALGNHPDFPDFGTVTYAKPLEPTEVDHYSLAWILEPEDVERLRRQVVAMMLDNVTAREWPDIKEIIEDDGGLQTSGTWRQSVAYQLEKVYHAFTSLTTNGRRDGAPKAFSAFAAAVFADVDAALAPAQTPPAPTRQRLTEETAHLGPVVAPVLESDTDRMIREIEAAQIVGPWWQGTYAPPEQVRWLHAMIGTLGTSEPPSGLPPEWAARWRRAPPQVPSELFGRLWTEKARTTDLPLSLAVQTAKDQYGGIIDAWMPVMARRGTDERPIEVQLPAHGLARTRYIHMGRVYADSPIEPLWSYARRTKKGEWVDDGFARVRPDDTFWGRPAAIGPVVAPVPVAAAPTTWRALFRQPPKGWSSDGWHPDTTYAGRSFTRFSRMRPGGGELEIETTDRPDHWVLVVNGAWHDVYSESGAVREAYEAMDAIDETIRAGLESRPTAAPAPPARPARPAKKVPQPTSLNIWTVRELQKKQGPIISARLEEADYRHVKRVLDAGWLEPTENRQGLRLTPLGEREIAKIEAREAGLAPRPAAPAAPQPELEAPEYFLSKISPDNPDYQASGWRFYLMRGGSPIDRFRDYTSALRALVKASAPIAIWDHGTWERHPALDAALFVGGEARRLKVGEARDRNGFRLAKREATVLEVLDLTNARKRGAVVRGFTVSWLYMSTDAALLIELRLLEAPSYQAAYEIARDQVLEADLRAPRDLVRMDPVEYKGIHVPKPQTSAADALDEDQEVLSRSARYSVAPLKLGEVRETPGLRFHRGGDTLDVTDLANAGRTGKKCPMFVLDWSRSNIPQHMTPPTYSETELLGATTYAEAHAIAADMADRGRVYMQLHDREKRGIDVLPEGAERIILSGGPLQIEATLLDFTITDRWGYRYGPPPGERMKRKAAAAFYVWLQENREKAPKLSIDDLIMYARNAGATIDRHYSA